VRVCPACISRVRAGAGWDYWFPTKDNSFDELFRAATVLLKENTGEDQIIPTLALAHHLCHGVPRLVAEKERLVGVWEGKEAWDEEADRFARRFGGLRPVRVVDGVLILKRRRVLVTIGYAPIAKTP
jgi:hypothetical protein